MNLSEYKSYLIEWTWLQPQSNYNSHPIPARKTIGLLYPLRQWLERIEVNNSKLAHRLCNLIPAQCPFAREIQLGGHTIVRIPPLCKLNPLYNELMMLRYQALCFLAEECGEDISKYC